MQHKGIPSKALNCFEKSVGAFIIIACVLSFAPARPASSQTSTAQGSTAPGESELTRLVNPFVGTDNDGNTFPGATVPFGMVQLSPDTTSTGWYKYQDTKIRGFSLTHFSGAGCPAYADVPFMPAVGTPEASPGSNRSDYAASFSHEGEQSAPGFYADRTRAQPTIDRHHALMWQVGDLMHQWEELLTRQEEGEKSAKA